MLPPLVKEVSKCPWGMVQPRLVKRAREGETYFLKVSSSSQQAKLGDSEDMLCDEMHWSRACL